MALVVATVRLARMDIGAMPTLVIVNHVIVIQMELYMAKTCVNHTVVNVIVNQESGNTTLIAYR